MYDAPLIFCLLEGRFYGALDAGKDVGADDEDVFDAPVFEFVKYGEPAPDKAGQALLRALVLVPSMSLCPLADMPRTIYAAFLRTPLVPYSVVNCVDEDYRIYIFEGTDVTAIPVS